MIVENFTIEKYSILNVEDYRILDDDGEYWYPMRSFFRQFLFREVDISPYRDNELYRSHMKVFEFIHPRQKNKGMKLKTWCINTEGMFLILQNTKIKATKNRNRQTLIKEEYLAAARNFFGIMATNDTSTFIGYNPDLSNYDVWSIMCLTRDYEISDSTIWKKCDNCGFYYPYNKNYFYKNGKYLRNQCRQCTGHDFVCKNKNIQYIYSHGGLDLLYSYYLNDTERIVKEFKKWLSRGGI